MEQQNTNEGAQPAPEQPMSQTGVPGTPVQVENVQYNVSVPKYESKLGLAFLAASAGLMIGLFSLAMVLHTVAGSMFGFGDLETAETLQVFIALMIPMAVIAFIGIRRMSAIISENPAALEDIKFKTRLRSTLWTFVVISAFLTFGSLFAIIGVFMGTTEGVAEVLSNSVFFTGGAIMMTLWLYSYQLKTKR